MRCLSYSKYKSNLNQHRFSFIFGLHLSNSKINKFPISLKQKQYLYHFVFLIFGFFFSRLIIQMNFPNFAYPYFSFPFMHDELFRYPFNNWVPTDVMQASYVEIPSRSQPQVNAQHVIKKLNKQLLIKNLKKFHEDQVRHKKTHWTQQEDKLLQKLVQIQKLEWREIPSFFKQRTQNMCYSRYRRISISTKDRNWTKDQQQNVIDLINCYGERWKFLSSKIPKFTPKQIRQKYLNYLRPNISKNDFTLQQDQKICQYVVRHGKHWRKMEEIVQGRSQGAIKGRYYAKLHKIIEKSLEQHFI